MDYDPGFYKLCPSYEVYRWDQYSAPGRNKIGRGIVYGYLKYSKEFIEPIYTCLACKSCTEYCPCYPNTPYKGIETAYIVRAMREDMVNLGLLPEPLKLRDANIERESNPFGRPREERASWAEEFNLPKTGNVAYFAGCYASYEEPAYAQAVAKIAKGCGVKLAYLGENEKCCGHVLFWDGQKKMAEEYAKHNIKMLADTGASTVIFSCAGCYDTFKNDYPEVVGKLPFDILHTSQWLANLIDAGKIKFKKEINMKVTYHDPCHLGRFSGVYEEPRKVIESIPGIKLVEMMYDSIPRNRNKSWCCGGGGGCTITAYPDLTAKVAATRIEDVMRTNAEALITTCPMCLEILKSAGEAKNVNMRFYDLNTLVVEAMGL